MTCARIPTARTLFPTFNETNAFASSLQVPSYQPVSGVELCARVRTFLGNRRPLYIIMMSSNDEYTNCVQALDNGADDFISKPPIAEELLARLRTADRVTSMQYELLRLATIDFLTGLSNRRGFFENAAKVVISAQHGSDLSAIMLDLDHFKQINDTHGHEIGDVVLKRVAAEIPPTPRVVGRLGGEEFGLLVEENISDAVNLAQGLRCRVEELRIFAGEKPISVTCSLGAAEWEAGDTIDTLLRRADVALYEAKRTGRNKVVIGGPSAPSDQLREWRGTARRSNRPS